ncbi:MAG: glycosyltransferase family 1 protein [Candidatus Latescibacteria bacterium]|nr:glycosyltransferase family 1 protein [Candidatus Latescibacterota bacterium]
MDRSGAPLAVWNLIRRLSPSRYEVALATGPWGDLAEEVAASGFRVFRVPALWREVDAARDVATLFQLMRIIRKGRYDLVHCHRAKAGFLGRLAARICGVRAVVYTPHGNVLEGYFGPATTWFFARAEGLAAPLADRIVSLTRREVAQYLAEGIGQPGQHTFIYNGIDADAFVRGRADRAAVRRELGVPSGAFLIASVGRLAPVKGHVHLIDALPEVLRERPDAAVLIAGDGPLRGDLESRARALGVADHVFLPGHRGDVAGVLEAADLFALPSLNEGLGLALVEAMAMGLATVASRVGGVPEVVLEGETGLLVPPGDAGALAGAILRLMDDAAARRRMGEASQARARTHFSIERAVRETERLYEELLR